MKVYLTKKGEKMKEITKQDLIGWASQGIGYVKTGFDHIIETIDNKLKDVATEETDCFKELKGRLEPGTDIKDVCSFKDRLSVMWEEKEVEEPKSLEDHVKLMEEHVIALQKLYKGVKERASEIDGKQRKQRKELEEKLKLAEEQLGYYRYYAKRQEGIKNDWSVDYDIEKIVKKQKMLEIEQIQKAQKEYEGSEKHAD